MHPSRYEEKKENQSREEFDTGKTIDNIVIVGGGTAGWITACIMAVRLDGKNITVVESPYIGTIGVGESTYVTIVDTMKEIGISEIDLFDKCDATIKQGIRFEQWTDNPFYHPFQPPEQTTQTRTAFDEWIDSDMTDEFSKSMSLQPHLCDMHLSPKIDRSREYKGICNYAYHIDSNKLADLLKSHATKNLGVKYKTATVSSVRKDYATDLVYELELDYQSEISGDFFVDCTGFRRAIIGSEGFMPRVGGTGIDSACFGRCEGLSKTAHTISMAADNGWIWQIPTKNDCGVGYCYSSEHMSKEDAEESLKDIYGDIDVNHMSFPVGFLYESMVGNVVAVGNSSGFVEPLESTAIGMIEHSAKEICNVMPETIGGLSDVCDSFNSGQFDRWMNIIDFIDLHYLLSTRSDTEFWRTTNDRIKNNGVSAMIGLWKQRRILPCDFSEDGHIFRHNSWRYMFYSMVGREELNYGGGKKHSRMKDLTDLANYTKNHAIPVDKLHPC